MADSHINHGYMEQKKEFFEISSLSREDLEEKGFDTSNVSDETMEKLASKMGDDYCEQLFWDHLVSFAEIMGIPRKEGWKPEDEE